MKSIELLDRVEAMVEDVASLEKGEDMTSTIRLYPECKKYLWWVYNPYKKFGVTSGGLKKYMNSRKYNKDSNILPPGYELYDLLRDLYKRYITGDMALAFCAEFLRKIKGYEEYFYGCLDKSMKKGFAIKTINKAWDNLVPQFSVARASNFFDYERMFHPDKDTWLWSRKLDGIRCETEVDGRGNIKTLSREGNEFTTLKVIKDAIRGSGIRNMVLSGEIYLVGEDGNEDFQTILGDIKKDNYTIPKPYYALYDYVTIEEHRKGFGTTPFTERLENLKRDLKSVNYPHMYVLEQHVVKDKEELMEEFEKSVEKGWEGIVIHKDVGYLGRKCTNLLKLKKFEDAEYQIKGVEVGPFTYYYDSKDNQGNMIKKRRVDDMVTSLIIEHKGCRVSVGSGYTIQQRREWYDNPNKIIGKWATVKYFEETRNKKGEYSLRFPTIKCLYDKERDI